jgi:hypothetical protein
MEALESIVLIESVQSEPLFKTREDYEKFCENYRNSVGPKLENAREKLGKSWHESQFRIVN